MTVAIMKHFDVFEFVKKAEESGVNQKFAEYAARQIEQLSENMEEQRIELDALKAKESATKGDVRESELRLLKEIEVVRKEIEIIRREFGKEIEVIRKEIEIFKGSTFKFIVYTGVGVCVYLTGILYTMLKPLIH